MKRAYPVVRRQRGPLSGMAGFVWCTRGKGRRQAWGEVMPVLTDSGRIVCSYKGGRSRGMVCDMKRRAVIYVGWMERLPDTLDSIG